MIPGFAFGGMGGGAGGLDVMGVVVEFRDNYSAAMTNYERRLVGLGAKARAAGAAVGAAWTKVAPAVTMAGAAVVGVGVLAGKQAMDFEKRMALTRTMMLSASEAEYEAVRESVKKLGVEYGQSLDTMADASYQLISAGVEHKDTARELELSARAAVAGGADVFTMVDVGTTAVNAYGDAVLDSARAYDILQATVAQGKTTMPLLASELGKVIPIAAAEKVSLEQVGAAMAVLTKQGISTAESATYLRGMILSLTKPTKAQAQALREVGGAAFEAAIAEGDLARAVAVLAASPHAEERLKELFPEREAMVAFRALSSDIEGLDAILGEIEGSAGAVDSAFDKMGDTAAFKMDQAKASIEATAIEIGEDLLPIAAKAAEKIAEGADAVGGFVKEHPKLTEMSITFAAIAASAGIITKFWPVLLVAAAGYAGWKTGEYGVKAAWWLGEKIGGTAKGWLKPGQVEEEKRRKELGEGVKTAVEELKKGGGEVVGFKAGPELGGAGTGEFSVGGFGSVSGLGSVGGFGAGGGLGASGLVGEVYETKYGDALNENLKGVKKGTDGLTSALETKTTEEEKSVVEKTIDKILGAEEPGAVPETGGGGGGGGGGRAPGLAAAGVGSRVNIVHIEKGAFPIMSSDPSLRPAVRTAVEQMFEELGFLVEEGGVQ
jgi:TP901 family phage tail tape measure protein